MAAQEHGATPPNLRPPAEQLREQRGAERVVPQLLRLVRVLVWIWALLEASVLVAQSPHTPPALARPLHRLLAILLSGSSDSTVPTGTLAPLTTPSPAFVAGTLLAFAGAFLRAHCYAVLGRHFTFELAIRPSHVLVTRGAYGVVRHPSYAGVLALALGWLLCVLDPRGVVVAVVVGAVWGHGRGCGCGGGSGDGAALTALLACVWVTGLGALFVGVSKRMDKEDAMLEKNFGEEWRAWVRRVPYRLVPGVY